MPKKKPVTTKKGQHHKFKSFMMNLVKDNDISKVDTNVLRKRKESFEKKKVTFEKRNSDPAHFHDVIYREFPSVNGMEFSLWRLPMNNSTLIPFPKNINNAVALCNYEDLNRSVIYIRLVAAADETQEEVPESSHFCEPDMNQDATSDDDEEPEEEMEASVSTEQTMPEYIAMKRKHLSKSEYRSQKRRSYSTGTKYKGIPSSSGAGLEDDHHEVASPMIPHSCETLLAVADDDDVNVSSVCIDTGNEKNSSPQDTLVAQMTTVPALNPVMDSQPSILDQFADVASNASSVASLPNDWIDNAQREQFLNAQMSPDSYLISLITGSIDLPELQDQFTSSNQIQRFDSSGCNENDLLNNWDLLQQQLIDSGQIPTDNVRNISLFPNRRVFCSLSTTGRQDSNMQPYATLNSIAGQHNINSGDASIKVPKAELIGKFDFKLRSIIGLAALNKRLYIISENSEIVAIHSSRDSVEKISDHEVKGMKAPFQIFASSKNSCLYIIDGFKSESKCIWKATDNDEFIANRLMEDVNCCCLSVTNEGDLVLLDDKNYCLHLYNSDGGCCFRCIDLSKIDRKEFGDPHFVISSLDNAFYIRSTHDKTRINMVYKISRDGKLLNTFGGRSGEGPGQLSAKCHHPLILDRYGRVIVLDSGNRRVLLLNSNLEYIAALLSVYMRNDIKICYDDEDTLFTNETYDDGRAYNIVQFEPDNLMKITKSPKPLKYDESLNKAHMMGNISMTKDIRGVAVLLDKIYIMTSSSICIHSCLNPFKRIFKRIRLEEFYGVDFWDIAADDECDNRHLYITDKAERCIWLMGFDLRKTKWLKNISSPYSLSVSKDGSVVIPNNRERSIDIYKGGKTAQFLLSIKLYLGLNNRVNLRHAIKVQEHYVVCHGCLREDFEDVNEDYVTDQVLLVSTNGDILRSVEGVSSCYWLEWLSTSDKLNLPNHLAVDREGGIIVADTKNKRVVRLNGELEQGKILLSNKTEGIEEPQRLSYDRKNDRLLICHSQSLDIFSFSLEIQKRIIDPKLSTGIQSLDLCQDVWSFEFPEFQKIIQVDSQTMKYKDKRCLGVAILREQLYLLITDTSCHNAIVCVHQSDPPFDLIGKVQIWGLSDVSFSYSAGIVASSAHDCCYIYNADKIYSVINGSQKAEEFLEDEKKDIYSMSVTAEGQLLVAYDSGKLAIYNYNGECTECIFPIDNEDYSDYGVKTGEGKFIFLTSDAYGGGGLKGIYEQSVDGSDCCVLGPFDIAPCPYYCKAITLGEDGQVFLLLSNGEVLSYDYKRHLLSVQLAEDDLKMSDVTGFCYSREKKQLLVCGREGIAVLQILQNKQNDQSNEGLESIERKKQSSNDTEIDKSSEDKKRRFLYSVEVDVSYGCDRMRGIARLGNNTYILRNSKLLVINSKDIRTNNFSALHHSLTIPEPHLELTEGGLRDIAASHVGLCLYVTDKINRCVWSVAIDHKINKWLDDIDSPYTLSVTEDGSVCILDNGYKQLDVYDSNAVRRKSIRLPRFMNYLRHAVQASSGNFVICCNTKNMDDDDDNEYDYYDSEDDDDDSEDDDDDSEDDEEKHNAITESSSKSQDASECHLCEVSPEGAFIRRFTSTESTPSSQLLVEPLHLAIDANDRIFVFACRRHKRRILLFDNQLKCIENITNESAFDEVYPRQLFYDSSRKELLVIGKCFHDNLYHVLMCHKI